MKNARSVMASFSVMARLHGTHPLPSTKKSNMAWLSRLIALIQNNQMVVDPPSVEKKLCHALYNTGVLFCKLALSEQCRTVRRAEHTSHHLPSTHAHHHCHTFLLHNGHVKQHGQKWPMDQCQSHCSNPARRCTGLCFQP